MAVIGEQTQLTGEYIQVRQMHACYSMWFMCKLGSDWNGRLTGRSSSVFNFSGKTTSGENGNHIFKKSRAVNNSWVESPQIMEPHPWIVTLQKFIFCDDEWVATCGNKLRSRVVRKGVTEKERRSWAIGTYFYIVIDRVWGSEVINRVLRGNWVWNRRFVLAVPL